MTDYEFITIDVFTDQVFGGNPLAVFPDARGLATADMQNITREFNFSELSFVLPPSDPANHARVRIFTPAQEIPFAGHPNVGTGFLLAQRDEIFGKAPGDMLLFEEKVGLVRVAVSREAGAVRRIDVEAAAPFEWRAALSVAQISGCLGLHADLFQTRNHPPMIATVGLAFCFVELVDLAALAAASPVLAGFQAAAASADQDAALSVYAYVRTGANALRSRMFAPLVGIYEDPATGAASGALGGLLASLARQDGTRVLRIEQGVEMGRPSVIDVAVDAVAGEVRQVRIGGKCVFVTRGVLTI